MLPLGYMAKRIVTRPEWLKADRVEEILSLSSCSSEDFADWINYWRHNGYWLFDSPSVIQVLAYDKRTVLLSNLPLQSLPRAGRVLPDESKISMAG